MQKIIYFCYKIIGLLTLDRAQVLSVITMLILGSSVIAYHYLQPGHLITRTDFPCFYIAGTIVNDRAPLYDANLQKIKYHELERPFPSDPQSVRYFAYTPFFALLFSPLALLGYFKAFIAWSVCNFIMFFLGFQMTCSAAGISRKYRLSSYFTALSWLPVFAWTILFGQTSIYGFFVFALGSYLLSKDRRFGGGLALSLLLYKPPLVVMLLPALVITRNWRSLSGFVAGGTLLSMLSLWIVGLSGVRSYLEMLRLFSALKANGGRPTLLEIDFYSFFFSLSHSRIVSTALLSLVGICLLPFLIRLWYRFPTRAVELSLVWTIVLNFYVLLYDATLLIAPVIMLAATLSSPNGLPHRYRILLILMFVVPWFERIVMARTGLQLFTPLVAALGIYQMYTISREPRLANVLT